MLARDILVCGAVAVVGMIGWVRSRYLVVCVDGLSMSPALEHGDRVVVRRASSTDVRSGQVILFASDPHPRSGEIRTASPAPLAEEVEVLAGLPIWTERWTLKRAVAVAGDSVPKADVPALRRLDEDVVPTGSIVVLGDNAVQSIDSRHFGYIGAHQVLGVVIGIIGRKAQI